MGEKVGMQPGSLCVCVCPVGLVEARERCDNLSHRSPLRSHMALLCPLLHARLKRPSGDLISAASGFSRWVRCTKLECKLIPCVISCL